MVASAQTFACPARRGTVVPFLALTIVVLVAFLALAIDLGMLAVAKTQAQQAADLAALTASRTINGISTNNYNQTQATTNAQVILSANVILGQAISSSQLSLTYGSYDYSQSAQTFSANYPATSGQPYTAVAATVTASSLPGAFSSIFGNQFLPNISATAQAVHRPRDVALVMDLSGSMRLGTCLGFDPLASGSRVTNNPDKTVPAFGHYSGNSSYLTGTSSNRTSATDSYTVPPSNTTTTNTSYSLTYINSFYQNAAYASTLIRAFDSYSSTDGGSTWTAPTTQTPQTPPTSYATTPGGDCPIFAQGSTTTYATDVKDIVGSTSPNIMWSLDGYSAYSAGQPDTSGTGSVPKVWTQADYTNNPFNGYTKGPGYWGKTFFIWPPDPRNTTAISGSTLTAYLNLIGLNSTDQTTLSNIWSTWQGQGVGPGSTGLSNLQNWLTGTAKGGASSLPTFSGYYTPTSTTAIVPGVTSWNGKSITTANQPKIYYAVCRLFNKAYPQGSSWSGSTLSSGTSFHADWRLRFFGTSNNTVLFGSSGSLNAPSSSGYSINYSAIVSWLTQTNDPFPTTLRGGRIKYYSAIPSSITGSWPSYGGTDQQFWVEFIDHVLGFRQTSSGSYTDISGVSSGNGLSGYGVDFIWGTKAINSPPSAPQYMNYADNPARGLLRFWFSPILMVDYLQNYNMEGMTGYYYKQSGDTYEAPVYTAKQAYVASINMMQTNHPNDWVTVLCYSWPRAGWNGQANGSGTYGRFNCVRSPLGPNYTYATNALLFPFSTIKHDGTNTGTEITPYDSDPATSLTPSADHVDTPRADGDTCFAMALMLCFNQFAVTPSSDTTLRTYVTNTPIDFPTGMAGGLGRKGAQKVIIFETDGLPNCMATATATTDPTGTYSYYPIRYDMNKPKTSEYPTVTPYGDLNDSAVTSQITTLVSNLQSTYSTSRNPFRLYALGFGPVFASGAPDASAGQTTLVNMQNTGNGTSITSLPSNQIITGTDTQMSANLVSAFTTILQNGVQIALIK